MVILMELSIDSPGLVKLAKLSQVIWINMFGWIHSLVAWGKPQSQYFWEWLAKQAKLVLQRVACYSVTCYIVTVGWRWRIALPTYLTRTKYLCMAFYFLTWRTSPVRPKVLSCGPDANLGGAPSMAQISTSWPTFNFSTVNFIICSLTSSKVGSWSKNKSY